MNDRELIKEAARQALTGQEPITTLVESGWIPVGERLPNDESFQLVIDYLGNYFIAGCTDGGWYTEEYKVNGITHWMPLPERPKGEMKQ